MTATAGPGWALMVESIGYALMTETPVVVAVIQRLGPSTGAATQGAQGDIAMVSGAVSGGYCFPVFAPSSAEETYEDTLRAFEWAERLRTPVVLLSDKEVASTSEVVDRASLPAPSSAVRATWDGGEGFLTYGFQSETDVPLFAAVGGEQAVTVTGSAHDMQGRLRKNDPVTMANLRRLQAKIEAAEAEIGYVDLDADEGADTLIISFGVTARACRDAVAVARRKGTKVSQATVRTLFPVPKTALKAALKGVRRVVVAEENHGGQYRTVLTPMLRDVEIVGINRVGAMIRPQEVLDVLD
jgi:2-oxoglutarate ferredoxin oxidoreductase subunit alpha